MEGRTGDLSQFPVNSTFIGLSSHLQKDLFKEIVFEADSRYGFYDSVLTLVPMGFLNTNRD